MWAQGLSGSAALQMASKEALPDAIRKVVEHGGAVPRITAESAVSRAADAVIGGEAAVGDTLIEGEALCRVHGGEREVDREALARAFRLSAARTFRQDPK